MRKYHVIQIVRTARSLTSTHAHMNFLIYSSLTCTACIRTDGFTCMYTVRRSSAARHLVVWWMFTSCTTAPIVLARLSLSTTPWSLPHGECSHLRAVKPTRLTVYWEIVVYVSEQSKIASSVSMYTQYYLFDTIFSTYWCSSQLEISACNLNLFPYQKYGLIAVIASLALISPPTIHLVAKFAVCSMLKCMANITKYSIAIIYIICHCIVYSLTNLH